MYILLIGSALIMGALSAIIFMNIYRKNKRVGVFLGVLLVLWFFYQMFSLSTISVPLAMTVFVIYLFFGIAAYRKLKAEGTIGLKG
ncbi:hypothetical protein DP119_02895 [Planococcus maitriensis]|uniref:Uncharacterized protein n=2 Tax=Planococcus maitriensis TaxID=221799 RepID=A0A365KBB9_9BACL|nr:hypothetical protein DP119_02895 [Planococcus maitriensis]